MKNRLEEVHSKVLNQSIHENETINRIRGKKEGKRNIDNNEEQRNEYDHSIHDNQKWQDHEWIDHIVARTITDKNKTITKTKRKEKEK